MSTEISMVHRRAEELERHLGDPASGDNALSYRQFLADDEQERFPEALHAALQAWGVNAYYIPSRLGGRLQSFPELLAIVKAIARRDLTAAIAHTAVFLGSAAMWLAGSAAQQEALAKVIRDGGAVAFGLTEKAHGSDLLASEVSAIPVDGGYLLSGEKWLINNAQRCSSMVVYARTSAAGGPRGFTLFIVHKKDLDPGRYTCVPKLRTHGIRGADISGIAFDRCFIGSDTVVAEVGEGLELILKSLQITRTMCAGLALGCAQTALSTALEFSLTRSLYGATISDIPAVRLTLVDAFTDMLINDCVATAATRGLHVVPDQFSTWSAVVKFFVPVSTEKMMGTLSSLLGARYYLREGKEAMFQKCFRDVAIISIFDGNTAVNLQAIGMQLRFILGRKGGGPSDDAGLAERLDNLFDLTTALPPFDGDRLSLFNHGRDDMLRGLDRCRMRLHALNASSSGDTAVVQGMLHAIDRIDDKLAAIADKLNGDLFRLDKKSAKSPLLFSLAEEYCACHAAAACLQLWLYNRDNLDAYFAQGEWLFLVFRKLLKIGAAEAEAPLVDGAFAKLQEMHAAGRFFSLVPFVLATGGQDDLSGVPGTEAFPRG